MNSTRHEQFLRDGVLVFREFVPAEAAARLAGLVDPLLRRQDSRRPGVRRALTREPRLGDVLSDPAVVQLWADLDMPAPRVVRSLIFDKSEGSNWAVPWHQDPTIAVAERIDVPGFGPWRVSDGIPHCQPPREVLESIVILRVHLDPNPPDNGPLCVVPGSHLAGVLSDAECARRASEGPVTNCITDAGGAVLMRPLTIHSSARATHPSRRRTLHFEFSLFELPGGLRWADA